jgi:DNA polymerase-1
LIDGNSLLYRSYYAIRQLSNSEGFATNAIYGFLLALRKLIDSESPHYLGIVFDSKGPTKRHEVYPDYKATRKPMPEDLVPQVPVLHEVLDALKIPIFTKPGYEGDDILGSLTEKARGQDVHVVIVSHDKDLYQLVDETTSVYNPVRNLYMDGDMVKEAFGVRPQQIVDTLALWGDASDNIPGVAGIGEKTAKNLISEFGSLDELLSHLDKIRNPRLREKIEQSLDNLDLSRRLATIERTLDFPFDLESFSLSEPDYDKLIPLLQKLEFSSLLSQYLENSPDTQEEYHVVWTKDGLKTLIEQIKKNQAVSLDTETDSPFPTQARLVGMSFSLKAGQASYLPLGHDYPGAPSQLPKEYALKELAPVLSDHRIKKIGQNIKYDTIVLKGEGLELQGIDLDTMVLSYLIEPNWGRHNLSLLALTYLQKKVISYSEIVGKGKNEVTMNAVEVEKVVPYACQDADLALQLSQKLWPLVETAQQADLYRQIEQPLIEVLADMETWGIKVDAHVLADLSVELGEGIARLQKQIFAHSGEEFNLNSPKQLAHILFEKLQLPATKKTRKTKGFSTSLDVLQELAENFPIARDMLEYRQLSKLKSTYADALPQLINPTTQRIHTSYNQTVAATGRLSSSDPNLQNIPVRGDWGPRFRQAFVAEPGSLFLAADYSQIELRVLAHMSQDPALVETFQQDRDIHQETALQVFGENGALFEDEPRRRAKIINFSIVYGTSAFSLAKELGTTAAEAQVFMDKYFEKYPKVRTFLEDCVAEAQKKGYSETLLGRRRQVPELRQQKKLAQQAGRRIALNTPIQGTAADLMKKAMIDIWNELKQRSLQSKMILQVHDELVFEVPDSECADMEKLVREKMESVLPLEVPLKVHLGWGVNWADAK